MTRKPFPVPYLFVALIPLFLMLLPLTLVAQEQAQEQVLEPDPEAAVEAIATATTEEVGERGAKVLGRLDVILKDAIHYREMLPSASPEDSLVLRLQLAGTQDKFMNVMGELAEVISLAKEDETQQELRRRGEVVFVAVTPEIWKFIRRMRGEIDVLRANRRYTPVAGRLLLETELGVLTGHLDKHYSYGWTHIQKMESFGLPSAAARDTLAVLLESRADELSGRLDLASLRISEFHQQLKDQPGDADLKVLQLAARKNLDINITSQTGLLATMDSMGLPTDQYRAQLVSLTQDIAAGLLDVKVAGRLLQKGWDGIRHWLVNKGPSFLVKLLLFLGIVVGGWFLAKLVSKAVEKSLQRANLNVSHLLKRMTVTFTKNTIIVVALVFGLAQLGFSLGPLLAGFGVVGFILGFAMQDSLSNLAAGMMILINRPYDVGDMVEISGVFGKVEHMSMVSTNILTVDNQKLVVPNSKIWGDVIKNVTDQRVRRVDMTFGISYTDDIPHAEQVLNDILEKSELVLESPEPVVRLHKLNDSSVDFVVRPWVKTTDYWDVYWEVTRAVKMRFDAEGISIPFPQRDVHIYEERRLAEGSPPQD
jgi:small conductance mechanosensitive channel